jgi:hypothetical protein
MYPVNPLNAAMLFPIPVDVAVGRGRVISMRDMDGIENNA